MEDTMRKKLNIAEGIFPMPVLMVATYNEDGSVNVMNAAWGAMQERGNVALNLTDAHKTVKNIKARGAFTVSIADAAHVTETISALSPATKMQINLKTAASLPAKPRQWMRLSSTNSRSVIKSLPFPYFH